MAAAGCREVTLLGQNVNSYSNPTSHADFADLLTVLNDTPGLERIRFMTSHPKDLSDRLIQAMAELPKVCEHIHLPMQSGDSRTLARMKRGYSIEHYKERVDTLRRIVPGVAITTDLLVGFPGETDDEFACTLRSIEDLRFDAAFMFAFNAIEGTAAASLPGQLPTDVKIERLRKVIELQNWITLEINAGQVGEVFEVLVEGPSPKDPERLTGLTRQNKTINFPAPPHLIGRLIPVRAVEGHLYGFVGELGVRR
jgi:tRNA-2-methylthio-N6-dimethylallyladenosine synthase